MSRWIGLQSVWLVRIYFFSVWSWIEGLFAGWIFGLVLIPEGLVSCIGAEPFLNSKVIFWRLESWIFEGFFINLSFCSLVEFKYFWWGEWSISNQTPHAHSTPPHPLPDSGRRFFLWVTALPRTPLGLTEQFVHAVHAKRLIWWSTHPPLRWRLIFVHCASVVRSDFLLILQSDHDPKTWCVVVRHCCVVLDS